jgi:hypothetical protein
MQIYLKSYSQILNYVQKWEFNINTINSHLHPSPIFAGKPKYYLIGVLQLWGWRYDTQHKVIQHNNKKMAHSAEGSQNDDT